MAIGTSVGIGLQRIDYSGYFDLNKAYSTIMKWFDENHYFTIERENTSKMRGPKTQIIIKIKAYRNLDGYFRYDGDVEIKTYHLTKEKFKGKMYDNGIVNFRINFKVSLDYRNIFSRSRLGEVIRHVYHNYLIKRKINEEIVGNLVIERASLKDAIKKDLDLFATETGG